MLRRVDRHDPFFFWKQFDISPEFQGPGERLDGSAHHGLEALRVLIRRGSTAACVEIGKSIRDIGWL